MSAMDKITATKSPKFRLGKKLAKIKAPNATTKIMVVVKSAGTHDVVSVQCKRVHPMRVSLEVFAHNAIGWVPDLDHTIAASGIKHTASFMILTRPS